GLRTHERHLGERPRLSVGPVELVVVDLRVVVDDDGVRAGLERLGDLPVEAERDRVGVVLADDADQLRMRGSTGWTGEHERGDGGCARRREDGASGHDAPFAELVDGRATRATASAVLNGT